jgi:protein-tyrosine phosphatase
MMGAPVAPVRVQRRRARRPESILEMTPSQALRRVLTSAPAMYVKNRLRDVYWNRKGREIANPALTRPVRSLLFICQGNICRSPFAALLAARMLRDAGLPHVECASAGLRATQAAAPPEDARNAANAFSISLTNHVPVQLAPALVARYDLLVVMEAAQFDAVRAAYPAAADRVVLLPLFGSTPVSGYARWNIADPFGRSRDVFDACYARIQSDVRALVRTISTMNASSS